MKLKKYLFVNIVIAIVIASAIVSLSDTEPFQRLKFMGYDFFFRARPSLLCSQHLVIVEITDEDISKVGQWPWKRRWHAALTRALKDFGAKFIYFDIIFSEPSSPYDDRAFSESIKESGRVYLPFAFFYGSAPMDSVLYPIPEFRQYIRGEGFINVFPDIDGVIRRIPLFSMRNGNVKYHIALQIASDYLNMKVRNIDNGHLIIGNKKRKIAIPLVGENEMLLNWAGRWKDTFKHYSFLDVLEAYRRYLAGEKPSIDIDSFKDSICIVAVTALGLYDIKPIPLEAEYPGVGATVTAINNIIKEQFVRVPPFWVNWLFIYILGLIPPFLISEERPLREILSVFFVGIVIVVGYILFVRGIMIDISLPLLSLVGSYIAVGTYNFARISMERRSFFHLAVTDELTGLYNIRYFRMLIRTEMLLARADPSNGFCVLMIDIDHFKNFNDSYGHQVGDLVLEQVAKVLKISLRSSDVIARYGGEEMIVILRGTFIEDGLKIAEKVRKNIEQHLIRDKDNIYRVTVSVGVSAFRDNDDEESVIKRADEALYKAKRKGRNCIATFERPA